MSGASERWVAFVRADDRSGVLTGLAGVFSTRGVSFESFDTLDAHGGVALMSVTFRASERLARVLMRTVERLAPVHSVAIERADDARVRAVAIVRAPLPAPLDAAALDVVTGWGGDAGAVIVAGPLAAVEAALAPLRAAGAAASVTVLPPGDGPV
jgi:acetolactate synthase small subunit